MPLRDRAVIELEKDGRVGEFHLPGASTTNALEREMLFGARGQLVREAFSLLTGGGGGEGRAGFDLDAGQGRDQITLEFSHGSEGTYSPPLQWGDGSGEKPYDVTGGHAQDQEQALQWWARNSKTDSKNPGKLYWGGWSDGTYADSPGMFGEPIDVVVLDCTTTQDIDETARGIEFEGTVVVRRTQTTDLELPDGFDLSALVPDF